MSRLADFDLVIPSLPGFVFSGPLAEGPTTEAAVADVWAELMTRLGYDRFGAYGGDIGSGVSTWLGARHPDRVIGIFSQHIKFPPADRRGDLSPAEEAFIAMLDAKAQDDWAYGILQETRPDTLAAALSDSPSGLAAWIIEKYQRWSDCGGDISRRFGFDELLTTVMLYWVTNCIGTSFRPYRDDRLAPHLPMVAVPAGITVSVEDAGLPRSFAERTYANLTHWHEPRVGGHFFAQEEPDLLAADLRAFFSALR
ncbi:alpha/beta fold hydrolase [Micromonospora zamorensis]|uniref:alpha/beta fold hydrolase n=1 Tax=Micromonospora zamorensis TaxID=709883 RepID=UPI00399AA3C2